MNANNITLQAYTSGTTLAINAGLDKAQDINFVKCYPGGQCVGLTFYVPRDITASWSVTNGQRVTAYNGLRMVWEGYISNITPQARADGMGMAVTCEGAWSRFLQRRSTRKPWADTRMSEDVWQNPTSAAAANDKSLLQWATVDRQNRIRFTPNSTRDASGNETGWAQNDYVRVVYTAPTGQTIKRITWSYDLQEGAQNWKISAYDPTAAADIGTGVTASGTGTKDETLGTPRQTVWLYFQCGTVGGATPPSDGTVYGEFSNIVVYTETGSINAQEITKDVRAIVTDLSADETQIGALTLSLVPFVAEGAEKYADLLTRAAGYGDSSFNRWAVYVGLSENASDGLPRLVLEQVPALTDYDYSIRVDAPEISGDLSFSQSLDEVWNWIAVRYQDANGRELYVTPDDDANLTDATSVAAYGRREAWIDAPTTSLTTATNAGRRYLAQHKDLQWQANGQVIITGGVRGKSWQYVPACEVSPGKRIRFENWLNDLSGTGLTLLITGTTYDDASETVSLDFGVPDTQDVYTVRLQRELDTRRV
jgi:hypothetical protein